MITKKPDKAFSDPKNVILSRTLTYDEVKKLEKFICLNKRTTHLSEGKSSLIDAEKKLIAEYERLDLIRCELEADFCSRELDKIRNILNFDDLRWLYGKLFNRELCRDDCLETFSHSLCKDVVSQTIKCCKQTCNDLEELDKCKDILQDYTLKLGIKKEKGFD